jgi:hypothetical protein
VDQPSLVSSMVVSVVVVIAGAGAVVDLGIRVTRGVIFFFSLCIIYIFYNTVNTIKK